MVYFWFDKHRMRRCHYAMQRPRLSLTSSHAYKLKVGFHIFHVVLLNNHLFSFFPSEGEKFHYLVMSVVVTAVKQGLRMRLEVRQRWKYRIIFM